MCCSGFLKIMMFIFNGTIFIAGAAVLGVGVWVKVDSGSLLDLLDSADAPTQLDILVNVSYLLIGTGAVLLLIGFLGCCGAVRESRCMLMTFFVIVLIIFIVEVAGAVLLFVFRKEAEHLILGLEDTVIKGLQDDYGKNDSAVTSIWDLTMDGLKCCGFTNYTDFTGSPFVLRPPGNYPGTCCNETLVTVPCSKSKADVSNAAGCKMKIVAFIEENAVIIAAVALGIAAIEIAAMVVSMVLYNQIGNKA